MNFEYDVTILESHLDTFGHVNNAVYLQLFEEARWEIINARDYGIKRVQELQVGPTILDVHLRFQREITLRERIKIRTEVIEYKGKICKLRQTMVNARGEDACIADFVMGLFDMKTRKLIEPTPEWKRALALD